MQPRSGRESQSDLRSCHKPSRTPLPLTSTRAGGDLQQDRPTVKLSGGFRHRLPGACTAPLNLHNAYNMAAKGQPFLSYDLGNLDRGDVVEVTLTRGANVELLDPTNLNKFQRGMAHQYYGGLAKRSPSRIPVPRSGHWHVVVHMQGLRGSTNASVRVIKRDALRPLPEMRGQQSDVRQIAENLAEAAGESIVDREFDAFISHASEDKASVARPLALALQARGLSVWYDELELRVGDSLRRKIDEGIRRSSFGVVVLSKPFFEKGWPQYELDGLVTLSVTGKQILLPIWHEITATDVIEFSPSLADRVALDTSKQDLETIANEIASVIESERHR